MSGEPELASRGRGGPRAGGSAGGQGGQGKARAQGRTGSATRARADDRLVSLGLAASRDEAARLILAGLVLDGSERIDKAGDSVAADAELRLRDRRRFVSRGGEKLDAALEHFEIDVQDEVCLDAGCSTGGFTDCLLQRGAALVHAVDVGYGQFAWSLRGDARVVLRERCNIRSLAASDLDPPPKLVVADLSFVSLGSILPDLLPLAAGEGSRFVLLVKPQFEVAAGDTERGVVVSEEVRAAALEGAIAAAVRCGLEVQGTMRSPLEGAEGNVEYLLYALLPVAR